MLVSSKINFVNYSKKYFRDIPQDRLKMGPNYVSFKIDVADIYKLAIRPEDIDFARPAKIGYVLKIPDTDEFGFLVKISDDIPKSQEDCFDVARDHPNGEVGQFEMRKDYRSGHVKM